MISCGWKASTRLEMLTRDLPTDQILILHKALLPLITLPNLFNLIKVNAMSRKEV